ncbi:hypothetical protein NO2_0414 [Candidatus Termititenax persephonae]|uniref:Uncharacterized protein n=1 Tax=Candidatus Termititenax persephonae TaxID=2218525 RepID=A0A388TFG2_9BACT|nr:hypothetical protein NO2_0414 [Candidatus Termititenax persephonae]
MIFLPNETKEMRMYSEHEYAFNPEDFWVYQYNAPRIYDSYSQLEEGYAMTDLDDTAYQNNILFKGDGAVITGHFSEPTPVNSLILGNCNGHSCQLSLSGQGGTEDLWGGVTELLTENNQYLLAENGYRLAADGDNPELPISRQLAPGQSQPSSLDQKLWIYHNLTTFLATDFSLTIYGSEPVSLCYLYIGMRTGLPRPETISAQMDINSTYSRNAYGQVSGMRQRSFRSVAASYPLMDDRQRRIVEEYVNNVQTCEPHVINPMHHKQEYIQPMYCTLAANKLGNQKNKNLRGWWWEGNDLSWSEAE